MKKILILGGTQFIGRNLVKRIQGADEYDITLFNRQQTRPDLFPNINKIKGDRETQDINQIANTFWDFVIDLSCYYPDSLINTLKHLQGGLSKYIFISTCSVYDNEKDLTSLKNELTQTLPCNADQLTDRTVNTYGNRKAECERILKDSGLNYIILRPSLVYGEFDPTDRFYYWLYQVKNNATLLLPDKGERTFSLTYVGDLVDTIVQALAMSSPNKVYNVNTIPQGSIKHIIDCAGELLRKDFKILNATSDFLKRNSISQWTNMPLWIDGDSFTYDNKNLREDFKMELTTLNTSVKETIDYYDTLNWPEPKYGIGEKTRQQLIEKIIKEKL